MKTIVRTAGAALLCLTLALSLCSCSMLKSIRENAEALKNRVILGTPGEKDLPATYNEALKNAFAGSEKISEKITYSVRDPKVEGDQGKADRMDKAADTLAKMIMAENPGKSEREIKAQTESLLRELVAGDILGTDTGRTTVTEAVTDEKGDNVIDEKGENVTQAVIKDNILTLTVKFYTEKPDPEDKEKKIPDVIASDDVIEAYFGAPADQTQVLGNFDPLAAYVKVNGYEIKYENCYLTAVIDLEKQTLTGVTLHKNMTVTAQTTGAGSLAELGDMTVTFRVEKVTEYGFTYAGAEGEG